MQINYILGLLLTVGLLIYLFYALVAAEKF
jgi:K+-transporting ATPase KdpF subunit